jgi:dTDP-4-amino-4,6-dideoxygalactose transaminase
MPLEATERAAGRVFSVPMFPELTDAEVARVAEGLSAL